MQAVWVEMENGYNVFSKMACWSKSPQNSDEKDPEAVRNSLLGHGKVPEQYRIGKYDADQ